MARYYFILMFQPHPPFSADSLCPQTTGTYRSCKQEHGHEWNRVAHPWVHCQGWVLWAHPRVHWQGLVLWAYPSVYWQGWVLWAYPRIHCQGGCFGLIPKWRTWKGFVLVIIIEIKNKSFFVPCDCNKMLLTLSFLFQSLYGGVCCRWKYFFKDSQIGWTGTLATKNKQTKKPQKNTHVTLLSFFIHFTY